MKWLVKLNVTGWIGWQNGLLQDELADKTDCYKMNWLAKRTVMGWSGCLNRLLQDEVAGKTECYGMNWLAKRTVTRWIGWQNRLLQDELAGKTDCYGMKWLAKRAVTGWSGWQNGLLQDEVAGKMDCRFRSNLGERTFKIKLETCTKLLGKVASVPVLAICKEEFSEIYAKTDDWYWYEKTRCRRKGTINPLKPNGPYRSRTAPLSRKRFILYIYSTNICTEYFKRNVHSPFFALQNAVRFIILKYFGSGIIHILYTGCAKIKKETRRQKVKKAVRGP